MTDRDRETAGKIVASMADCDPARREAILMKRIAAAIRAGA